MIPDGVEILILRQRKTAAGDAIFTGKLGGALVVLIRDDVERDVWRLIATDPARANTRNSGMSPARAIAPPADDGDPDEGDDDEGDAFDNLPEDLLRR